jgi:threonyl-tRNA synthetase
MIHRAMLGSYERFIGILIEHYAGDFPVWLAPVQAIVLPIAARHNAYAVSVHSRLRDQGLRVDIDERDEKVGRKVRDAELRKIPYLLVVGDREEGSDEVSVRRHRVGDEGTATVEGFANRLAAESYTRAR